MKQYDSKKVAAVIAAAIVGDMFKFEIGNKHKFAIVPKQLGVEVQISDAVTGKVLYTIHMWYDLPGEDGFLYIIDNLNPGDLVTNVCFAGVVDDTADVPVCLAYLNRAIAFCTNKPYSFIR